MARGITMQVEGLDRLKKKLGSLPQNVIEEVDVEMAAVASDFVNRAIDDVDRLLINDEGNLKSKITKSKKAPMDYEIVSGANYSAYVEFGTITKVQVPVDLVSYALQFKGKGIRKNGGMIARPFFFPQMPIAQSQLNQALKGVVDRAIKK